MTATVLFILLKNGQNRRNRMKETYIWKSGGRTITS